MTAVTPAAYVSFGTSKSRLRGRRGGGKVRWKGELGLSFCMQCGGNVDDTAQFCPSCGAPAPPGAKARTGSTDEPPQPGLLSNPPIGTPMPFGPEHPSRSRSQSTESPPVVATPPPERAPRSRARIAVGVLCMLGLAGVGLYALRALTGGSVGGAASAEGAIEGFARAVGDEDALGALDFVAPDELAGMDDFVSSLLDDLGSEGIVGARPGEGLAVDFELDDVAVREYGEHVAFASVSFTMSVDTTALTGPVGAALPDAVYSVTGTPSGFGVDRQGDDEDGGDDGGGLYDFRIALVELDGRWYVSPMLTAGDLLTQQLDLPSGDFDIVGAEVGDSAGSSPEVVNRFFEAISARDTAQLGRVVGAGEGRFVRVFADAINELTYRISPDVSFSMSATTASAEDGVVPVDQLDLQFSSSSSSVEVEVRGTCAEASVTDYYDEYDTGRGRGCLEDLVTALPFDVALPEGLEMVTVTEDGQARVSILGTLARGIDPLRDVDMSLVVPQVLDAADLEHLADAPDIELQEAVTAEFDGQPFSSHKFEAEAGTRYSVVVDPTWSGDGDWVEEEILRVAYPGQGDDPWQFVEEDLDFEEDAGTGDSDEDAGTGDSDGVDTGAEGTGGADQTSSHHVSFTAPRNGEVRIVVFSQPNTYQRCERGGLCPGHSGEGSAVLEVTTVETQTVTPGSRVKGALAIGEEVALQVDVERPSWIKVDGADEWGVVLSAGSDTYQPFDPAEGVFLVTNDEPIVVANTSDRDRDWELEIRTLDVPVFDDGTREVRLDGSTAYLLGEPGTTASVSAINLNADAIVYAFGNECSNLGGYGEAEVCDISFGSDGYASIEVRDFDANSVSATLTVQE